MKVHDGFLHSVMVIADRVAVFGTLVAVILGVVWNAVCCSGLGIPEGEAWVLLVSVLARRGARLPDTLFLLCVAVALLTASAFSFGLFTLWKRQADVRTQYVRGPRAGG